MLHYSPSQDTYDTYAAAARPARSARHRGHDTMLGLLFGLRCALAASLLSSTPATGRMVTAHCEEPYVDCTESLQSAMNATGASLVVVPRLPGGRAWPVRPMVLANGGASNRTIVLQAGVEIVAMSDPVFHWPYASPLLTVTNASNFTVRGEYNGCGATIRMHRQAYLDPTRYKHSEYRHGLALRGGEQIVVQDLNISQSGGDGVYMTGNEVHSAGTYRGYCRDVLINRVVCDRNTRQGMSVIGAVNLLVQDSEFSGTNGSAPMAGIVSP